MMIKSYSFRPKIGNYINKKVMIIDNGSSIELARILSKDFLEVRYYVDWKQGGFPFVDKWAIGRIPGVHRIDNMWDYVDDTDLFIFTDVLTADVQKFLLRKGKLVWGARGAERLENERLFLKQTLKDLNLPVGDFGTCTGTKQLREYLKEHEDVYVKIDRFRGTMETFHSENYDIIEPYINELDVKLGPIVKNKIQFIIEEALPEAIETGLDVYMVDGKYPDRVMGGLECKNAAYLCKILPYNEFPKQLTEINDKLSPYFKQEGYRGAFSTEVRITEDYKNYFMDATCRQPLPPSQLQWYMYKNLADIYWETAAGNLIDVEIDEPYGCELIITSDFAKRNWLNVNVSEEYRNNVFWERLVEEDSKSYIAYENDNKYVGSIVASGMNLPDAIKKCKDIAKSISGIEVMYDSDALYELQETIQKMKKMDINFF